MMNKAIIITVIGTLLSLTSFAAEEELDCRKQVALHFAIKHMKEGSCSSLGSDLKTMHRLISQCNATNLKILHFTPAKPVEVLAKDHPVYNLDVPLMQYLRSKVSPTLTRREIADLYQYTMFDKHIADEKNSIAIKNAKPSVKQFFQILEVLSMAKFKDVAVNHYLAIYEESKHSSAATHHCQETLTNITSSAKGALRGLVKEYVGENSAEESKLLKGACSGHSPFTCLLVSHKAKQLK